MNTDTTTNSKPDRKIFKDARVFGVLALSLLVMVFVSCRQIYAIIATGQENTGLDYYTFAVFVFQLLILFYCIYRYVIAKLALRRM